MYTTTQTLYMYTRTHLFLECVASVSLFLQPEIPPILDQLESNPRQK